MRLKDHNEPGFEEQSTAMRVCNALGMRRVAWTLRRLHCPVPEDALVLEVGAGGNPYPRSNVLLDGFEDTVQRGEDTPLVRDRPLVLGMVENLPFRTKAFDFVIACHVLEHSPDPAAFLSELMRVARAGYIETPNAFFERLFAYKAHRLQISMVDGSLRIRKKPSWRPDGDLVEDFDHCANQAAFHEFMAREPSLFNIRYYWRDRIDYTIVNPDTDASWPLPPEAYQRSQADGPPDLRTRTKHFLRAAGLRMLSQQPRNERIELGSLLQCPTCRDDELDVGVTRIRCRKCTAVYEVKDEIPKMFRLA